MRACADNLSPGGLREVRYERRGFGGGSGGVGGQFWLPPSNYPPFALVCLTCRSSHLSFFVLSVEVFRVINCSK